jgi:oligogalacturonide lyase
LSIIQLRDTFCAGKLSRLLVNMSHHDYREEPNVRFSPDKTMLFFTNNLFGASYVFGVEVKKAENPAAADVKDTAELGEHGRSKKST